MLLCFIVILFICVVVGVIKYSTAHSLKQEKDIKLSTIDNEKFTMEKYYTDSKPLLIIYFHPECYFCSMEMYQTEALPHGESLQSFCVKNKVPYNIFQKWYRDTRKKVVEVQVDGAPVIGHEEQSGAIDQPQPVSPGRTDHPVRIWVEIRISNGLHLFQKNLSYPDLVRMVEKLEGLC